MKTPHLTRELLAAVRGGHRPARDLVPVVLEHLRELCPKCAAEYAAFEEECDALPSADHAAAIERTLSALPDLACQVAVEEHEGQRHLGELLALPEEERLVAVASDAVRYAGPVLAELLLVESFSRLPGEPREALGLAQLAREVLQHTALGGLVGELYARAVAHAANAWRALGELPTAEEHFRHARFLLRVCGGGDLLLDAELDRFEGSLRRAQRRFEEAVSLLRKAELEYRMAEEPKQVAVVLLKLGNVLRELDRPAEGLAVFDSARELLDALGESPLRLYLEHNRAACLYDAGNLSEARETIKAASNLYERHGDGTSLLRRDWLQGKIARGSANLDEAEHRLLAAREGFARQGLPFDAALVALDLAALYLEQRRTGEVRELAAWMVGEFERRDVHREALAALLLLRDAAELDRLSAVLVREVARYLAQAQRDPRHAFCTPS